jgi:mannose/fructose/N-acetylgalactosamine-specific phosphotransferase system component IID
MGQATCTEGINSDQSCLKTLKDGILGPLGAGMGDSVKLSGSGGGILSPNAENISNSGRITNTFLCNKTNKMH